MRCHVCNAEVGESQRFCHECGESLEGVTDPTEALDMATLFETTDEQGAEAGGTLPWADDVSTTGEPLDGGLADAIEVGDGGVEAATQAVEFGDGAVALWSTPTGEVPSSQTTPPTEPLDEATPIPDPPATVSAAVGPATTVLDAVPPTAATTVNAAVAYDHDPGVTAEVPGVFDGVADVGTFAPAPDGPRFRLTLVLGVLAVLTAVLATLADVTDVRTDRVVPGIENRLRQLDDIGSNLAVAAIVGAGILLIGGLAHCFGQRWGAGLAGGAGLALGGWAAVTIGLAEVPISTAQRITLDPATPGPFVLTVTRDLGFWLVIALGAIGGVTFLLSLVSAGAGGRPGLDPWTAALGALGGVIAAAGPLVPVGPVAELSSNLGVNDLPVEFFAGRLVQVGVLALASMLGFLLVRTYGLGLAAGALSIPVVMWATALAGIGDAPIGLAVGNIGTTDIAPHAVTTTGIAIALTMLLVASVIAIVRRPRPAR